MPKDTAVIEQPTQEALTSVQRAFDKVAPDKLKKVVKDVPLPPPPDPVPPPKEAPKPAEKVDEIKMPAFLEKTLGIKGSEATEAVSREDEIPAEPPAEIKDEKAKSNWKKLRERKDAAEKEAGELRIKLAEAEKKGHEPDEATRLKLEKLDADNKKMAESLTRFGLETSDEFQTKVIRPLHASYARARKIVQDAGGDVGAFDKALTATGRAQYEALDEVYSAIPDSAKRATDKALETFRELSEVRNNALRNAPQTFEQIRRSELLRQKEALDRQKGDAEKIFDDVVKRMSDNGFELFQESKDPETSWWNEIKPKIVSNARNDYLNATGMDIVAESAVAKSALPIVTELWRRALQRAIKAESEVAEFHKADPSISESGGGARPSQDAEDAKLPFEKLFLKTLKKQKSGT